MVFVFCGQAEMPECVMAFGGSGFPYNDRGRVGQVECECIYSDNGIEGNNKVLSMDGVGKAT